MFYVGLQYIPIYKPAEGREAPTLREQGSAQYTALYIVKTGTTGFLLLWWALIIR